MSLEIWKPIPRFSGSHQVSNLGRVRSVPRVITTKTGAKRQQPGKLMKSHVQSNGYAAVTISKGGEYRPYNIHVLVLEAFEGPRPDGMVARHLNGDRLDNRANNLAWGTPAENQQDRHVHGTATIGEKHPMAKLTLAEVHKIRGFRHHGFSTRWIANRFGISRATVNDIAAGRIWKEAA